MKARSNEINHCIGNLAPDPADVICTIKIAKDSEEGVNSFYLKIKHLKISNRKIQNIILTA
jgi:hypothetical protein